MVFARDLPPEMLVERRRRAQCTGVHLEWLAFDAEDSSSDDKRCDGTIEERQGLRIRPLRPADMRAVSEMTDRCSRDTIYHRFHGFIDLPTYLGTLLPSEQKSVVAWWGGCCIGLASLGPGSRGQELAVLVEDAWQRHGVGAAMLEALVDLAKGLGFGLLHADVLFEDVFILGVLARYGRLKVEHEYGDYSVAIHLDDGSARRHGDTGGSQTTEAESRSVAFGIRIRAGGEHSELSR